MSVLNEKTEITKKNIHLLITTLCDRKCPNCCNNLYAFEDIPYVTKDELKEAENVFLTGGEPFKYSQPDNIAGKLKSDFPNIKKVYAYTNAMELYEYCLFGVDAGRVDGLTISIKTLDDKIAFEKYLERHAIHADDIIYYFGDSLKPKVPFENDEKYLVKREWQPLKEWKPAPDSIFRKL